MALMGVKGDEQLLDRRIGQIQQRALLLGGFGLL